MFASPYRAINNGRYGKAMDIFGLLIAAWEFYTMKLYNPILETVGMGIGSWFYYLVLGV